jgi:hypothetical protein
LNVRHPNRWLALAPVALLIASSAQASAAEGAAAEGAAAPTVERLVPGGAAGSARGRRAGPFVRRG